MSGHRFLVMKNYGDDPEQIYSPAWNEFESDEELAGAMEYWENNKDG